MTGSADAPISLRAKLGAFGTKRVSRWVKKRQGEETLPVTLRARRLYILPTSIGVTFGIVVVAMLLGSMNYNNSMGFALTFLLAATGLVAMHRCHQNLGGLTVSHVHAEPVFAGQPVAIRIALKENGTKPKYDIRTSLGSAVSAATDIIPGDPAITVVTLKAGKRGPMPLPRLGLSTRFPLALLRCWVWIYTNERVLIWPAPSTDAPPRPLSPDDSGSGSQAGPGDEDFAGLRDYQRGDSSRRVAWKTYARIGEMKTRMFDGSSVSTSWIDLDSVSGYPIEQAMSVLCRWILEAHQNGETFGLRLGMVVIEPGDGLQHRNACLDALALFDGAGAVT